MFINYVRQPYRRSSTNVTVARVFVCGWLAFKTATYPFAALAAFPEFLFGGPVRFGHLDGIVPAEVLLAEQALAVTCLLCCAAGVATATSSYGAALILTHLTAIGLPFNHEKTFLPGALFLLLYGLHREADLGTFAARRHAAGAATAVNGERHSMACLRAFLLVLALIYFFTGLCKVRDAGWSLRWATADNLSAIIQFNAECNTHVTTDAASWVLARPFILRWAALGTLLLELGLLPVVLLRRSITPWLAGLASLHLGIWATMRVNYFSDLVPLYAIFMPWDDVVTWWRVKRGQR